jgi:hypothetical protein
MALATDGTRQALRSARAGNDAQLDFRLAELGVIGGDDEVAHHGQLATAAQGEAADGGDHWLAHAANLLPIARDEIVLVNIGVIGCGHGANICAGGKGFFAAGDDHAADAVIRIEGLERRAQLVHQLVVQCVELLGAVQPNHTDLPAFGALPADFNDFVIHGCPFELRV